MIEQVRALLTLELGVLAQDLHFFEVEYVIVHHLLAAAGDGAPVKLSLRVVVEVV